MGLDKIEKLTVFQLYEVLQNCTLQIGQASAFSGQSFI